eukprot:3032905-Pyramimonas_sp.AAC.1
MIQWFEDAGLRPVPIFINGVEAHTIVRDQLTSAHEQVHPAAPCVTLSLARSLAPLRDRPRVCVSSANPHAHLGVCHVAARDWWVSGMR